MDERIRFRQWSPPTRSGHTGLRKADDPAGKAPGAPLTPMKPKTIATSSRSGGATLGSPEPSPISTPTPAATSQRSGGVTMSPTQAGLHTAQVGAQRVAVQRGSRSGGQGTAVRGANPQVTRQPALSGPTVGTPKTPPAGATVDPGTSRRSGGQQVSVGQVETARRMGVTGGSRSGAAGDTVRAPDLPVTKQSALRGPTVGTPKTPLPGAKVDPGMSSRSGGQRVSAAQMDAARRGPVRSGAAGQDIRGPTMISAARGKEQQSPIAEHAAAKQEAQDAQNKKYGASPEGGSAGHPFAQVRAERGAAEAEKQLEGAKAGLEFQQQKIADRKKGDGISRLPERSSGPNVQGWAGLGEAVGSATPTAQGGQVGASVLGGRVVGGVHGLLNRRTPPSVEASRQQREAFQQRQQALRVYRGEAGGVQTKSLDGTPPVRSGTRRLNNG